METAFILYDNSLFASGLEQLLRQQGVAVVGLAAKTKKAIVQITELNPDVIIAEAGKEKPEAERLLSRLLREHPQVKVVLVSLENNTVTLYTGCRWTASTVEDLVKGIPTALKGGRKDMG